MTPEDVKVLRTGYPTIQTDTRQAIAVYYGDELLQWEVLPFSGKEDPVKLLWRQRATVQAFDNYVEEILEQYIDSIVRAGKITRDSGTEQVNEYLDTDYGRWFNKEVMPLSLVLPELYITVEVPELEVELQTQQDVLDTNYVPNPKIVFPNYIKNYKMDFDGELDWIVVDDANGTTDKPSTTTAYDKINIYHYDNEGKLESARPHKFGRVPFLRFAWRENYSQRNGSYGRAMMYSIIRKSLSTLSYIGMLLEAGHYHLFPKLVANPETIEKMNEQGVGADTVIPEIDSPDSKATLRYLALPTNEMDILERILYERIPTTIYRAARLRDRSTDKVQSGFSKMIDMVPEIGVLSSIAQYYELIDTRIIELLMAAYPSGNDSSISVSYPETFDVKSVLERATEVSQLSEAMTKGNLPQSETGDILLAQGLYASALPDLTEQEKKKVFSEIQTNSDEVIAKEAEMKTAQLEAMKNTQPMNGFKPNGQKVLENTV